MCDHVGLRKRLLTREMKPTRRSDFFVLQQYALSPKCRTIGVFDCGWDGRVGVEFLRLRVYVCVYARAHECVDVQEGENDSKELLNEPSNEPSVAQTMLCWHMRRFAAC